MPTPETLQLLERGGFAVAFFLLAWWTRQRIDKSEDRCNSKNDSLELYIRTELSTLAARCASALEDVRELMKAKI